MSKSIVLTQGKVALVDDNDFERLSVYNWQASKVVLKNRTIWYAVRMMPRKNGKQRKSWMHREVLNVTDAAIKVDHRNGDGLLNIRENLRLSTNSQNQQNRRKVPGCRSRLKGVFWYEKTGRWIASIRVKGRLRHHFKREVDVGLAYDLAATKEFGEFALPNY